MLRKKNKTVAENAARLGCISDIRPAAVENPKSSLNQTYQIPDEMRSTI